MRLVIFLKAQTASILGSGLDYFTTIILTESFNLPYIESSFAGNVTGGILQFFLCRTWAFTGNSGKIKIQILRFIIVFCGNLILSAIGLFFLARYLGINYLISKTIVSIVLGVSYNYLLQNFFVFI
jgi:putative flippase GtrA